MSASAAERLALCLKMTSRGHLGQPHAAALLLRGSSGESAGAGEGGLDGTEMTKPAQPRSPGSLHFHLKRNVWQYN